MEIIEFPGQNASQKSSSNELSISRVHVPHDRLLMNGWDITCHNCGTKSKFDTTSMIVRMLEFYCKNCGHLHRITNPAFSSSSKINKKA